MEHYWSDTEWGKNMSLEDKPDHCHSRSSPQLSQVWPRTEHEPPPRSADNVNCFGHVTTLKFVPQRDHNPKTQAVILTSVIRGRVKSKGKIHLTALIEVTVSNFIYHFST